MKSAVNKIFYGIIISSVALSIGVVPLFNDFIGILLILSGLNELSTGKDENGCFMKASKACTVLSAWVLIGYVMKMSNLSESRFILLKSAVMPSIGIGLYILMYYFLIKGLKERAEGFKEIVKSYNGWWTAVFASLFIMLAYQPFSINFTGTQTATIILIIIVLISIIIKISFAVNLRKNEFYIQTKESGNEE